MIWPDPSWTRGVPDDSSRACYSPLRWAQLMALRKLDEFKCSLGHKRFQLVGCGMYQCPRCLTWWTVIRPMTQAEESWRPQGFTR